MELAFETPHFCSGVVKVAGFYCWNFSAETLNQSAKQGRLLKGSGRRRSVSHQAHNFKDNSRSELLCVKNATIVEDPWL